MATDWRPGGDIPTDHCTATGRQPTERDHWTASKMRNTSLKFPATIAVPALSIVFSLSPALAASECKRPSSAIAHLSMLSLLTTRRPCNDGLSAISGEFRAPVETPIVERLATERLGVRGATERTRDDLAVHNTGCAGRVSTHAILGRYAPALPVHLLRSYERCPSWNAVSDRKHTPRGE